MVFLLQHGSPFLALSGHRPMLLMSAFGDEADMTEVKKSIGRY
jgi:hypothetical protein